MREAGETERGGAKRGRVLERVKSCIRVDWVAPPVLPAVWVRPAEGSGEQPYISFCFDMFLWGANRSKLASPPSPRHAIGWFNTTTTTGKRQQAANSVQSQFNSRPLITASCAEKRMTAASPDQRARGLVEGKKGEMDTVNKGEGGEGREMMMMIIINKMEMRERGETVSKER